MKKKLFKTFATAILIITGCPPLMAQIGTSSYKLNNANIIGDYNCAFGTDALKLNSATGDYNTAIGYQAIYSNFSGIHNTAAGNRALYNNGTGGYNTAVGSASLYSNTAGISNVAIGTNALFTNNTGTSNVGVGTEALYSNSDGDYNVAVGRGALYKSLTNNNTAVGYFALNAATGTNNTANGYRTLAINTTGNNNTAHGYGALETNTTGTNNTAIGYKANVSTGSLNNATAIGANAIVSRSNSILLGSTSTVVNVGIGISAPLYQLQLSTNSAAKPGSSAWTVPSDRNLKGDITNFEDGLAVLNKINPVWFKYNGKAGMPTDEKFVGIVAQEMKEIAPYTIGTFTYQDATGKTEQYLDYNPNAVTYITINAIKEQQKMIEDQQKQINELKELVRNFTNQPTSKINVELSDNKLGQNSPNPANGITRINFIISKNASKAEIRFQSSTGQIVKTVPVAVDGKMITVSTNNLSKGIYIYSLVVDGKIEDSKTMIVQ